MTTKQEQININVKWARNANHRLIRLYKEENKNWDQIHEEMELRYGFMKLAKLLKSVNSLEDL